MPRPLIWGCRAFGYAWTFLLSCTAAARAHDAADLRALIVGYTLIGVLAAVWAFLDLRDGGRALSPTRLAWLLGLICAVAGVLSGTKEGTLSVVPAGLATLVAGAELELGAALAVAGAGVLGVMAGAVTDRNTGTALLVGLPICIVSGQLLGRHRRTYRVQAVQATELLERTRELQIQQRRADVLDERTRIAREIHDVLAHSLGSLSIQIQAARAVLADDGDRQTVLDVLADAQRLATGGLAETRRALQALRADAFSLERELRTVAAAHAELHGSAVDLEVTGEQGELDPAAAMTLLRVTQESLVNAAKHAPGASVQLHLTYAATQAKLVATNPIPTPSPAATTATAAASPTLSTADSGYGLTGMRERLLLAGGTLEAGPIPHAAPHSPEAADSHPHDDTWRVAATLPRPAPPPATAAPQLPTALSAPSSAPPSASSSPLAEGSPA